MVKNTRKRVPQVQHPLLTGAGCPCGSVIAEISVEPVYKAVGIGAVDGTGLGDALVTRGRAAQAVHPNFHKELSSAQVVIQNLANKALPSNGPNTTSFCWLSPMLYRNRLLFSSAFWYASFLPAL